MLRRLQCAGAQAIAALWLDRQAPHTPSWTVDWLEVVVVRLEAWKAFATLAGAQRALEFAKVCYPGLDLTQLSMFRQEAGAELVAVECDLTIHTSVIAEYTNTGDFVPELNENGAEAPLEWCGLNLDDGEDSTE